MQADDALRAFRRGSDGGDGQRGSVGGEDGVGLRRPREAREEVLLQREIFGGSLDDEIGLGRGSLQRRPFGEPPESVLALRPRAAPLLHCARERISDSFQGLLDGAGRRVEQLHLVPGARRHLRDAGAHRSRADHRNPLHFDHGDGHQTFPK